MISHKLSDFTAWSYENSLDILANRFPDRIVCLCKPSLFYLNSFACYDAFVERLDKQGTPKHAFSLQALPSLSNCLEHLSESKQIPDGIEDISFVGFSKGSIVLNQILFEIHIASQNERIEQFISKFREFYWLDSGHNGTHGIWISDEKLLESFAKLNPKVYVGTTPYQMKSVAKPWTAKEKEKFVEGLAKAGIKEIEDVSHFDNEPASLDNHFKILKYF